MIQLCMHSIQHCPASYQNQNTIKNIQLKINFTHPLLHLLNPLEIVLVKHALYCKVYKLSSIKLPANKPVQTYGVIKMTFHRHERNENHSS